jgi:NAD(P)-dependent dehydrogenase (short-subunit alcohol dehydrogenase family)
MKEFRDRVAVVTGAASGIGRALADRCMQEGMKVVLADVDEAALCQTEQSLKHPGANVLAVRTDVSKSEDVESLAQRTLGVYGAVHLLFNNAGVDARTTLWEATLADWQWVIGVNLWGVIHGVRTFVPIMLRQGDDCHVVNTSSIAGLISGPGIGVYKVTKHGVVSLSETLACELAAIDAKIKVSVLCPAGVNTKIMDAERNRPRELQNAAAYETAHPATIQIRETLRQLVEAGLPPSEVASKVFDAIRNEKFYILTHADWKPLVQKRMEDILQERNPDETEVGPLKR